MQGLWVQATEVRPLPYSEFRNLLEAGARILLDKETLEAAEIEALMAALRPVRVEPAPRRAA